VNNTPETVRVKKNAPHECDPYVIQRKARQRGQEHARSCMQQEKRERMATFWVAAYRERDHTDPALLAGKGAEQPVGGFMCCFAPKN
jgi:hypothetical protein